MPTNSKLQEQQAFTIREAAERLDISIEKLQELIFKDIVRVCVRFQWENIEKFGLFDQRSPNPFSEKIVSRPFKTGAIIRLHQQDGAKALLHGKVEVNTFYQEPRRSEEEYRVESKCIEYTTTEKGAVVTKDMLLISSVELLYWIDKGLIGKKDKPIEDWVLRAQQLASEYVENWKRNSPLREIPSNIKIAERIAPTLESEGYRNSRGGKPPKPETIKRHALDKYLKK
ncbi:MAG: hypothetical protein MI864_15935 [Pseudomonadales bacterium]|nr:hypothetical protein [Pseudomonadales bacterium]